MRIEESFIRRLETLSDEARRLLLVAAAEPLGEPLLVLRASEQLGIVVSAVDAETDGLLAIGERVIFRHPLVRSAVYRSAEREGTPSGPLGVGGSHRSERRSRPSGVASGRSGGGTRRGRRGGARALRGPRPSPWRAGRHGRIPERAAALTEDPARRAGRALAAAQASVQAGAFDAAHGLLASTEADPLDESGRALIDLLRAQLAFASSRGIEATPLLLAAARRLEPLDLSLARETYLDAFSAALFGARLNRPSDWRRGARRARRAASIRRRAEGQRPALGRAGRPHRGLRHSHPTLPAGVGQTLGRECLPPGKASVVVAGLRRRP